MPSSSEAALPVTEARNPVPSAFPQRMPHLKALTSVRALAALYVGVYHMVRPFELWGRWQPFWSAGYSAVSFFFFLSGFILVYTHGPEFASGRGNAKRFWVARFARVYPLYFLVTIAAGFLVHQQFHPAFHIIAYVAQLLMLHAWHIRMTPFFNVVAWSLSEEAFFYFVFPFVAGRLQPRSLRQGLLWLLGLYLLVLIPSLVALHVDPTYGWSEYGSLPGVHHIVYITRRFPPLVLSEFLCGIVFGWIYLQRPVSAAFGKAALFCGGVGLALTLYFSDRLPFVLLHNGALIPFFALILYGLAKPNFVSRAMSWGPFVLLGEASYAFYLIHYLFNGFAASRLGWSTSIAGLLPRFAVLVPLSILLHIAVERRGRRYVMQWWDARRPHSA